MAPGEPRPDSSPWSFEARRVCCERPSGVALCPCSSRRLHGRSCWSNHAPASDFPRGSFTAPRQESDALGLAPLSFKNGASGLVLFFQVVHCIDTELLAVFQIYNFYNFSSIEILSSGLSEENIIEVTFRVWIYGFRFRGLADSFETASTTLSFAFFPAKENPYLSSDS